MPDDAMPDNVTSQILTVIELLLDDGEDPDEQRLEAVEDRVAATTLVHFGSVLACHLLGSPPDVSRARPLVQSDDEVPGWQQEMALRYLAGEPGVGRAVDGDELLDAVALVVRHMLTHLGPDSEVVAEARYSTPEAVVEVLRLAT